MCHFLFSDPIKEEREAACINTCTLVNAKTRTDISGGLKDRDGEIQSPSTDGYHASGKEQVWTAH